MIARLALGLAAALAVSRPTHAAVVTGTFAGAVSSVTDGTGVFGAVGADLTGAAVTGTFSYDPDRLSSAIAGATNTATGIAFGAVQVTITIGGVSHGFTDQTSSSIILDAAASEFTLQSADSRTIGGSTVAEAFFLDVLDPATPFLTGLDLDQSFTSSPLIGSGTFSILNTGPDATAGGAFSVTSISLEGTGGTRIPEPGGALLLGLLGAVAVRRAQRLT